VAAMSLRKLNRRHPHAACMCKCMSILYMCNI
jgi:hypothetical protein